jgi:hypothetical protein
MYNINSKETAHFQPLDGVKTSSLKRPLIHILHLFVSLRWHIHGRSLIDLLHSFRHGPILSHLIKELFGQGKKTSRESCQKQKKRAKVNQNRRHFRPMIALWRLALQ